MRNPLCAPGAVVVGVPCGDGSAAGPWHAIAALGPFARRASCVDTLRRASYDAGCRACWAPSARFCPAEPAHQTVTIRQMNGCLPLSDGGPARCIGGADVRKTVRACAAGVDEPRVRLATPVGKPAD